MRKKKIVVANVISKIILFIMAAGLIFLHLSLYEKFVLGWDKDCKEQIQDLENELEYPPECQDFGKYHFMLIFSVGAISYLSTTV